MILEEIKSEIKTSEDFKELEFNVRKEDMGILFDILRSKLYKDPIGSICREISSNSRDANREVENLNPIEISIENDPFLQKNLTIVFKDKGPGISPKRMGKVFINYCASTKRTTNKQTGGYGLGAKTPFSYTRSFSIVTIVDGIEYSYIAAIEGREKGKIYCIEEKETNEENGTSIIVPIKDGDRRKFEKECYKSTLFWDIKPIYKNFETECSYEELYRNANGRIVKVRGLELSTYKFLIDGIIYDIDSEKIDFARKTSYDDNYNFVIEFKTGDLQVSANRESIIYDDEKTIKNINSIFNKFLTHIKRKLERKISKQKDYLNACITLGEIADSDGTKIGLPYFYKILSKHSEDLISSLKYKGNVIERNCNGFYGITFYLANRFGTYTELWQFNKHFRDYPVYLINRSGYSAQKNLTIFKDNQRFIAIRFDDERQFLKFANLSKSEREQNRRKFHKTLESIRILRKKYKLKFGMYGNVKNTKIERVKKEKDILIYGRIYDVNDNDSFYPLITPRSLNIRDDGVYYDSEKIDPKGKNAIYKIDSLRDIGKYNGENIKRWIEVVAKLTGYNIYVINKKDKRHFTDFKTYEEVLETISDSTYQDLYDSKELNDEVSNNDLGYLTKLDFNNINLKECIRILKINKKLNINHSLPFELRKRKLSKKAKKAKKAILTIIKNYPLLEFISSYEVKDKTKDEINKYIRLIDKENENESNS